MSKSYPDNFYVTMPNSNPVVVPYNRKLGEYFRDAELKMW